MRAANAERHARVVSVGRNAAWIALEVDEHAPAGDASGSPAETLLLASLRKNVAREMLVPGDLVVVSSLDADRVVIERREPRTFTLERTTAGGRTKTMAANVDGIAIVTAFARPPMHAGMVDELLAFAEIHGIEARLIFTKVDLAGPDVDVTATLARYTAIGYRSLAVNPKTGAGVEAIRAEFAGHRTLLIGQSGVGKSSLFAALGGRADVGDVGKTGRGKQTTTTGRLYRLPDGFLIDSPGVGEFELHGCTPGEVALGFIEFGPYLGTCRFADCTHRSEPGCAILCAVSEGLIAVARHASYVAMVERG